MDNKLIEPPPPPDPDVTPILFHLSLMPPCVQLWFARRRHRRWQDKQKRKRKRDSEKLALYRDWPPDLVDQFLDYQNNIARYGLGNYPNGYASWSMGISYAEFKEKGERFQVVHK